MSACTLLSASLPLGTKRTAVANGALAGTVASVSVGSGPKKPVLRLLVLSWCPTSRPVRKVCSMAPVVVFQVRSV